MSNARGYLAAHRRDSLDDERFWEGRAFDDRGRPTVRFPVRFRPLFPPISAPRGWFHRHFGKNLVVKIADSVAGFVIAGVVIGIEVKKLGVLRRDDVLRTRARMVDGHKSVVVASSIESGGCVRNTASVEKLLAFSICPEPAGTFIPAS